MKNFKLKKKTQYLKGNFVKWAQKQNGYGKRIIELKAKSIEIFHPEE